MRNASSRQLNAFTARDRKIAWRVYVDDAGGTPVDWTDWVRNWEVFEDQEEFVMGADVAFFREHAGTSLAPYMSDPAAIDVGRAIEIQIAGVEQGDSILTDDWVVLFRGTIDDAGWGGDASTLTVPARGKGRNLMKGFIRTEVEYGNAEGTVPAQNVMQAILDAVFGSGAVPMDVEGDPDFGLFLYTQQRESVRDAHQAIIDRFGWVARYKWSDAYEDWRYTLYEPDRSGTSPVHTFGPGDYLAVESLEISTADIRNEVEVLYAEGVDSVVVIDSDSIVEFGGEGAQADYFFIDVSSDPQINTLAKATALAVAILTDLSQPRATHEIKLKAFPFIELADPIRLTANQVHYNTDQDAAVVAYRHAGDREGVNTWITVRGVPSGGASRWFSRKQKRDRTKEIEDVVDADPEGLGEEDVTYRYAVRYASQGNTEAGTQEESLGNWMSTTPVEDGLNGAFRDVDDTERAAGIVLYRLFFLANFNADPVPQTMECVVGWLPEEDSDGIHWAIALDPTGTVPTDSPYLQAFETGNEQDEPVTSPGLDWVSPDAWDHPDALDVGDVEAGECFGFWVRLTVDAGATGQITDEFVTFADRIPEEV